jgi:hypothetical protein
MLSFFDAPVEAWLTVTETVDVPGPPAVNVVALPLVGLIVPPPDTDQRYVRPVVITVLLVSEPLAATEIFWAPVSC